jgi:2-polyprenyl-3-methyl-5-hydroxy-6-metoxy-1,4-benzoquinol methylase
VNEYYSRCNNCDAVFYNSKNTLEFDYKSNYFEEKDGGWAYRNERIFKFLKRAIKYTIIQKCESILDFGSGTGYLVDIFRKNQFNAFGYEPMATPVYSKENIINSNYDKFINDYKNCFDVVFAIEVVEHIDDPIEILGKLLTTLNKNGVLIITSELFDKSKHKQDWWYLNPDAGHILIHSKQSLNILKRKLNIRYSLIYFRHGFQIWYKTSPKSMLKYYYAFLFSKATRIVFLLRVFIGKNDEGVF